MIVYILIPPTFERILLVQVKVPVWLICRVSTYVWYTTREDIDLCFSDHRAFRELVKNKSSSAFGNRSNKEDEANRPLLASH